MSELQYLGQLQFVANNSVTLIVIIPAVAALLALISGKPFGSIPGAIAIAATLGALASAILSWAQGFVNPIATQVVITSWSIQLVGGIARESERLALTFRADALSTTVATTFNLIFLASALVSFGLRQSQGLRSYHSSLLLLACAGVGGAILADDLLTLYIFLELTTIACAAFLLIPLTAKNVNAAKNLLLVSIGVGTLMLFGILWLLGEFGTVALRDLWARQIVADFSVTGLAIAALLLAFVLKAAVIPFHAWLVDAIDSAISPLGLVLASATAQIGVYSLIRVGLPIFQVSGDWRTVVGVLGAVTAIVSAVGVIQSTGHRRSLALLAVGQMGFALIALGAATSLGEIAALLLIVNFGVYFPLLFIAIEEVRAITAKADNWQQTFRTAPVAFVAMAAGALGVAGIPPLNGFTSYLLIYQTLLESGTLRSQLLLGATIIATGLTSAAAISLFIKAFGRGKEDEETSVISTRWRTAPLIVLGFLSVSLGIMPNTVLSELVRPMTAAANIVPIADVTTRANTLTLIEAFVLFTIAISAGAATYLRQNGLLQEESMPYARTISMAAWPISQLAPVYRVLDFLLQRKLLDASAATGFLLRFLGNAAYAILYHLAIRYLPSTEEEWEQETQAPYTEPRAAA